MYIVCFLTFRKILQNFIVFNIVEGLQINFKAGCQEGIPRMGHDSLLFPRVPQVKD